MAVAIDRDSSALIGIGFTECVVALIFVILRLWSRSMIAARGWDDVFMAVTWVLYAITTAFGGAIVLSGGTHHVYELTTQQATQAMKLIWIAQPSAILALASSKIAVGLFLLRWIAPIVKWRKRLIWALMIATATCNGAAIILTFSQCERVAALWDPDVYATTRCLDPAVQVSFSIFVASLNGAVDVIFALLPATIIWNLCLTVRKRLGLAALLGCGIFAGICATIKTTHLMSLTARTDLTWEVVSLYQWNMNEIFIVIVCGCIYTLNPVWVRIFGRKSERKPQGHGLVKEKSFRGRLQNQGQYIYLNGEHYTLLNGSSYHVQVASANESRENFCPPIPQLMNVMTGPKE